MLSDIGVTNENNSMFTYPGNSIEKEENNEIRK